MTNVRAERVLAVARLAQRPARTRSLTFLAEGPASVREALAPGWGGGVRELYLTPDSAVRHAPLERAALEAGAVVRRCSDAVLAVMSGTRSPAGIIAVCDVVDALLVPALASAASRPFPLVALLARVRDPGNAGTVVRTADAAGAGAVVLSAGSVDVRNPKCVRSTAGSIFHLDVVQGPQVHDAVSAARAAGFTVLAADGAESSHELDDLLDDADQGRGPLVGPVAWLFGNEAQGLEDAELALADAVVRAPLHGRAESLNLAAAAAVCLYATARAQRTAGRVTPGARSPQEARQTASVTPVRSTPLTGERTA